MQQPYVNLLPLTIGLDLGSQSTQCAIYDRDGKRIEERKVTTSRPHLTSLLKRFPHARVVMEVSTASRWIDKLAKDLGHEVLLANPRKIPILTSSVRECAQVCASVTATILVFLPNRDRYGPNS